MRSVLLLFIFHKFSSLVFNTFYLQVLFTISYTLPLESLDTILIPIPFVHEVVVREPVGAQDRPPEGAPTLRKWRTSDPTRSDTTVDGSQLPRGSVSITTRLQLSFSTDPFFPDITVFVSKLRVNHGFVVA